MERLTKHSKQTSHENGACCTHFLGFECIGVGGNCAKNCKWEEAAWSRLAAYEDTGLMPEEVSWLIKDWLRLCTTIRKCGGLDRLRELAEADKDGQLGVLPNKSSSTITNADRIRNATNQQLAKQIYDSQKELCRMLYKNLGFEDELNFSEDYSDILAWLNAPAKEAEKALEAMKDG